MLKIQNGLWIKLCFLLCLGLVAIARSIITARSQCVQEKEKVWRKLLISFDDCELECLKRPNCVAINYLHRFNLCELLHEEGPLKAGHCDFVRKQDMLSDLVSNKCNCRSGEYCNTENACEHNECPPLKLSNGTVFGNMNFIGARAKYKCDPGFEMSVRNYTTCVEGKWDPLPQCLQNVALNKKASMISLWQSNSIANESNGVDGNTSQIWDGSIYNSCFHTEISHDHPWWRVDLGNAFNISIVRLYNRLPQAYANNTRNVVVLFGAGDSDMRDVAYKDGQIDDIHDFKFSPPKTATIVKIQMNVTDKKYLFLCEVQVLEYVKSFA